MFSTALQEEQLGLAHIFTLASIEKLTFDQPRNDIDSIDATIQAIDISEEGVRQSKPRVDIQLKSTIKLESNSDDPNNFFFDLPIKNYNDLRDPNIMTPRLLVVYKLPRNQEEWVQHTEEYLKTCKCAYWCSLKGLEETDNTTTIRIKIPKSNILSPQSLRKILVHIAKRGEVNPNEQI